MGNQVMPVNYGGNTTVAGGRVRRPGTPDVANSYGYGQYGNQRGYSNNYDSMRYGSAPSYEDIFSQVSSYFNSSSSSSTGPSSNNSSYSSVVGTRPSQAVSNFRPDRNPRGGPGASRDEYKYGGVGWDMNDPNRPQTARERDLGMPFQPNSVAGWAGGKGDDINARRQWRQDVGKAESAMISWISMGYSPEEAMNILGLDPVENAPMLKRFGQRDPNYVFQGGKKINIATDDPYAEWEDLQAGDTGKTWRDENWVSNIQKGGPTGFARNVGTHWAKGPEGYFYNIPPDANPNDATTWQWYDAWGEETGPPVKQWTPDPSVIPQGMAGSPNNTQYTQGDIERYIEEMYGMKRPDPGLKGLPGMGDGGGSGYGAPGQAQGAAGMEGLGLGYGPATAVPGASQGVSSAGARPVGSIAPPSGPFNPNETLNPISTDLPPKFQPGGQPGGNQQTPYIQRGGPIDPRTQPGSEIIEGEVLSSSSVPSASRGYEGLISTQPNGSPQAGPTSTSTPQSSTPTNRPPGMTPEQWARYQAARVQNTGGPQQMGYGGQGPLTQDNLGPVPQGMVQVGQVKIYDPETRSFTWVPRWGYPRGTPGSGTAPTSPNTGGSGINYNQLPTGGSGGGFNPRTFSRGGASGQQGPSQQESAMLVAITDIARMLQGQGQQLYNVGMPAYSQAIDYYRTLLGGSRGAMAAATGATKEAIRDQYKGAQGKVLSGYMRGGERDRALAELGRGEAGDIARITSGVQPMAAEALMGGGLQGIGASGQFTSQAGSFYNTALTNITGSRIASDELGFKYDSLAVDQDKFAAQLKESARATDLSYNAQMSALALNEFLTTRGLNEQIRQFGLNFAESSRQYNQNHQFNLDQFRYQQDQDRRNRRQQTGMGVGSLLAKGLSSLPFGQMFNGMNFMGGTGSRSTSTVTPGGSASASRTSGGR